MLTEKFQETDGRFRESRKELDARFKETSAEVSRAVKAVSDLTGKWGRFVEGLIAPAAERLFREKGIEINTIYPRVKKRLQGEEMEIDILAVDGEYAVLIEAKSTLRIEDVNNHIERLQKFRSFFPEYSARKVVGAVGGIVIDESADKYAYKKGLYVIAESGNTVKILNDAKFKHHLW
ncbi:DUF3782 domain-containing protein [candidate division NPL-UPA2 bacterium]|nr:DUF3782 domain-containing protein [candidate division NPL-UPA2 bacterium]